MKNKILICALGLIALALSGCGIDQYAIEKEYWKAQKQANQIFNNPFGAPPNELEKSVKLMKDFIRKYPKNRLALEANFNIAKLYFAKEEYAKSRQQLDEMSEQYKGIGEICATALFLKGSTYEKENKWDAALKEYKKVMEEYPITLRGLDMPMYIANNYKVKYQPEKMIAAYKEAIGYYEALSAKYPDTALAMQAKRLTTNCYILLKDWQGAINQYTAIIEKYKNKFIMDEVMIEMAVIYQKELNNKDKAKETLNQLIKDYPKSRLVKVAKALLKGMDKK